ncbi:putative phage abortive infection protein [Yersinia enterocolitica]|nr:hypothetical protein [Yersinia enterocolitica]
MENKKESKQKRKTNQEFDENDKWNLFFYGAGFIIFLSLLFYLLKFHDSLSNNHTKWGEFGSYLGGVTGPLVSIMAFIGLLKSISLTKKQFEIQSQESTFFNLLNFHASKVESISLKYTGSTDAFQSLCDSYETFYSNLCVKTAWGWIVKNPRELPEYTYFNFINHFFGLHDSTSIQETKEILEKYVKRFGCEQLLLNDIALKIHNMDDYRKTVLVEAGRHLIRNMSSNERVEILGNAFDHFYGEFGHISGPYIRNVYYTLSHANESIDGRKYAKIFRAQLSRHELSLIYFNMLSSYCRPEFIYLIKEFDILNGLYIRDLCYNPSNEMYRSDLDYIFSGEK